MKKLLLGALAFSLVMGSCKKKDEEPETLIEQNNGGGDNTPTLPEPDNPNGYIPVSEGSYWVYDYSEDNGAITDIKVNTIVPGTEYLAGKDHLFLQGRLESDGSLDTTFMYQDGEKFFQYFPLIDSDILIFDNEKELGDTWMETGLIDLQGQQLPYDVSYEIIEKDGARNVNGVDYNKVFAINMVMTITLDLGGIPLPIPGLPSGPQEVINLTSYYAYNVGQIEFEQIGQEILGQQLIPSVSMLLREYEIVEE